MYTHSRRFLLKSLVLFLVTVGITILGVQLLRMWRFRKIIYMTEKQVDAKSGMTERDRLVLEFYKRNKNNEKMKRLPDIIGIGAEKCGTGWLQFALQHHPMIKVGLNEVHFFNNGDYFKGMEFYRSKLPNTTKNELCMEKTPGYFNFGTPETPARIISQLPNVKLWLVLCNPTLRTFSDFVHETALGSIKFRGSFDNYVNKFVREARIKFSKTDEDNFETISDAWHKRMGDSHILTRGIYYHSLKRWLKYFSLDQLFVVSGEELQYNSGAVVEKLQDFLGIPRMILPDDFVKNPDTGLYCIRPTSVADSKVKYAPMNCYTATAHGRAKGRTRSNSTSFVPNPNSLKILDTFFKPYNDMLFEFIGRKLW
ncbi:heparan sulfate glucosamine 3-O-sulfotransferase 1-like isoform X1 [Styela clava]